MKHLTKIVQEKGNLKTQYIIILVSLLKKLRWEWKGAYQRKLFGCLLCVPKIVFQAVLKDHLWKIHHLHGKFQVIHNKGQDTVLPPRAQKSHKFCSILLNYISHPLTPLTQEHSIGTMATFFWTITHCSPTLLRTFSYRTSTHSDWKSQNGARYTFARPSVVHIANKDLREHRAPNNQSDRPDFWCHVKRLHMQPADRIQG